MKPDFWLRAVRGRYCLRQSVRAWQPENQQKTWRISETSLCTYIIRWWYTFLSWNLSSIYRYICKSCLLILRAIWQKLNWQNYALKRCKIFSCFKRCKNALRKALKKWLKARNVFSCFKRCKVNLRKAIKMSMKSMRLFRELFQQLIVQLRILKGRHARYFGFATFSGGSYRFLDFINGLFDQ